VSAYSKHECWRAHILFTICGLFAHSVVQRMLCCVFVYEARETVK
jgi:hypothetical protein